MLKWLKKRSSTEIAMMIIIVILLIGIIVRWDFVRDELSEIFSGEQTNGQTE